MLRYALRVLPRPEMYAGCVAVAALLALVDFRPWLLWQLAGVAVATAGAVTAYLFDEPAAAIVDTLPRPRWWRTTARLLPAAVLAVGWLVGASMVDADEVARNDVLRWQGFGAILAAAAAATVLRRRGQPTPGHIVASAMLLVLTYFALMNPIDDELPLFPFGAAGEWNASRWLWTGIAAFAAVALAATCIERRTGIARTEDREERVA